MRQKQGACSGKGRSFYQNSANISRRERPESQQSHPNNKKNIRSNAAFFALQSIVCHNLFDPR